MTRRAAGVGPRLANGNPRDPRTGQIAPLYDWDSIIPEMCEYVAGGGGLKAWCLADPTRPSFQAVFQTFAKRSDLLQQYRTAMETRAYARQAEFDDVNATLLHAKDMVEVARVRAFLDNVKWQMAKENGAAFSDKTDVTSGGKPIGPVTFALGTA